MIVDLVRTTTRDGLRLDGAFQPRLTSVLPSLRLDAVCMIHGTGGSFYTSSLFEDVALVFRELGCGVLRINTRGHDLMSVAAREQGGGMVQGAAFEVVDQCRHDVHAWMNWLRRHGASRIALLGHSLGAVKVLYAVAQDPSLTPDCLLALSPPHLSYSHFRNSPKKEEFLSCYERAEQLVSIGEPSTLMQVSFPLPMAITAGGYLEKYGAEERYNYYNFFTACACPMLMTFGEEEVASNVAFQGSPDEIRARSQGKEAPVEVKEIANGDHFYSQAREPLCEHVGKWLKQHFHSGSGGDWQI